MTQWNETEPIFIQIRRQIADLILKEVVREGEALPSIRQASTDLEVNPLTVTKAYQSLVDLGIVEKKRGMGMYVADGAREKLLAHERRAFLEEEWPRVKKQIEALGLDLEQLLKSGDGK